MNSNTFGKIFSLTSFGESHGKAIGGIIDGCPVGISIDINAIQLELDRRKPGQSKITTQRKEADQVVFLSGLFEGKTLGSPISFQIMNSDQKSKDYSHIKDAYRPSHADYTYDAKYGIRDYRGGGRSSARETIARVVAGAIAKQVLQVLGVDLYAYVSSVGVVDLDVSYDDLDLSKIEAGKVELYNESFSLPALLEEVADTSRTLVEQKNNQLLLNIEPGIAFINADVTRTKQIVLNLISNAAKFCENGKISINVKSKKGHKKRLIEIDVKDSGIGMTQEQIDKLFHAFTQADASTTRKYGGTGLGLTIVQNLAKLMGGDVSVKSELGKGTTFKVTIQDIEVEKTLVVDAEDLESLNRQTALVSKKDGKSTILVIDDDPTIRDLMTRHLEKNNFSVLQALDGAQGIKMAREYKPDAITLDILMPEMDGWSVLRTLKADKQVSDIPVVMASIIDEKKKGFSLGAADYLSKPVERDRLIGSISKLLGGKAGKVVLIVEDNDDLRFTVREALTSAEYIVLEASNGQEALDILNNNSNQTPDLILLDLMMPKMNGFEFLEVYRKEFKKQAPVVVITGADLDENDKKFLSSETSRILEKSSMSDTGIADNLVKTIESLAGVGK